MVAQFGYGVLVISFLTALFAIGAAVYGYFKPSQRWVESARNAMMLSFPLITIASLTLIYLITTNHFELDFVYSVTSRSMPTYLKVTALWGGQVGSLLFWSWLLAVFTSAVMLRKWDRDREFLRWVIVVCGITMAFFLGMNLFFENPFAQLYQTFEGIGAHTFQPANSVPFTPADGPPSAL